MSNLHALKLINLQTFKIAQSMGFDQKNIFHRLAKLLEEQGELADAIILEDLPEIIEESVDNLLVVTSIAYVLDHDAMDRAQVIVNQAFDQADKGNNQTALIKFLAYTATTGKLSDAVQKNQQIAASSYKGFSTSEQTVEFVYSALKALMVFVATQTTDIDNFNRLIIKKNDKWLQKSIEGQKAKADMIEQDIA